MNGQQLIDFINNNSQFKLLSIHYILVELLKQQYIKPSAIIDSYSQFMQAQVHRFRCHYEDACVSACQLFHMKDAWTEEKRKEAETRFLYNTSFSTILPNMSNLSEEDRKYWSDFFEKTYDFKPENKI